MEDCIFCKIINKEIPSLNLYEDDNFIVFKDIKPAAPVHVLIMPKEHINSINELEEKHKELMGEMLLLAKKMAKDLETSDGYKLHFSVGQKGGQTIDHVHLHLMGGW